MQEQQSYYLYYRHMYELMDEETLLFLGNRVLLPVSGRRLFDLGQLYLTCNIGVCDSLQYPTVVSFSERGPIAAGVNVAAGETLYSVPVLDASSDSRGFGGRV